MSDVPLVYVDTSALGALLVEQAETQALVDWLDRTPARLVSSDLLGTELRRMAVREGRDQSKVSGILDGGHHRAPSIPDLLIAATAEKAGLTVLAVDTEFDLIAEITSQSFETLGLQ